ncbi:IclR family transcriptional regulator [Citricoccus sp. SGAir0253]|uniref:IclR family transcriptional regulator n=1 Tax=Citricoccus sp. SGAir0253 TaxID=2567881 RepID=UPI0010CD63E1|nr:IclR family transcriptional regulator [Citricoccus sp. SGAir0253]QCU77061.1 IclR family transcriptional regulator [Citricoccus sp. SGAir0253]
MAEHGASDTTLDRLIRILGAFDAERSTLSVAALARRASIPLPTAYRWVDRLTAAGLLERGEGGAVGPGMRLWELASRSSPGTSLRQAAMPYMDDVQAVLRQHTQIAVLDPAGVLVLERLSARGAVPNQATIAGRLPPFTTALGLVLLAHARRHVTESFLAEHAAELGAPLSDFWHDGGASIAGASAPGQGTLRGSARGVVNPTEPELRAQLAEVRRRGWASVDGQIDSEATGVAVPVLAPDGQTIAALGVVVPRSSEFRPGLAPMLLAAARGISRALSPQDAMHPADAVQPVHAPVDVPGE